MPYAEGRLIHDADAHIVETPDWLEPYADPDTRPKLKPIYVSTVKPGEEHHIDTIRARRGDPADRSKAEAEIMLRKNWSALGSFIAEDRPRALDLLGFASQLVFNTFANQHLLAAEHGDDLDFAYGIARAHNRAIVDFCAADRRLLAVGYVPLADFARAKAMAAEALAMGCKALMVASACPRRHSPSHVGLDPVWAQAEEAGVPVVFHVGGGRPMDPAYKRNGLPDVPDFHGGDGNFTSVSYMAIGESPMQTLATMIFDGVLDRFPTLMTGVIEQGASWLPGWMRSMDSAAGAFVKNETRLQRLSLKPSEFVHRQVRVTPYPHEDSGWIIANSGEEICMFSSDYPHIEGGRAPLKRFDAALAGTSDEAVERFYSLNFVDLMGGSPS